MVEFKCLRYKNNVPFVTDVAIDDYAEAVVGKYNPKMLKEVAPIDYMHFLESFLRLDFRFTDIYFGSGHEPVLGATAFNDGDNLKIFDKERECVDKIILGRGSIVLDNTLTTNNMEQRQRFTGLHEGGHWLLHQRYYTAANKNQMSFFEQPEHKIACCRTSDIEPNKGKRELITDEDFLEHQANVFASAIAMPRRIVHKISPSIFKTLGLSGSRLHLRKDEESLFAQDELVLAFRELFNLSKQATRIRLEKLRVIVDSDGKDLLNA